MTMGIQLIKGVMRADHGQLDKQGDHFERGMSNKKVKAAGQSKDKDIQPYPKSIQSLYLPAPP